MKKLLSQLLALLIAFSCAACADGTAPDTDEGPEHDAPENSGTPSAPEPEQKDEPETDKEQEIEKEPEPQKIYYDDERLSQKLLVEQELTVVEIFGDGDIVCAKAMVEYTKNFATPEIRYMWFDRSTGEYDRAIEYIDTPVMRECFEDGAMWVMTGCQGEDGYSYNWPNVYSARLGYSGKVSDNLCWTSPYYAPLEEGYRTGNQYKARLIEICFPLHEKGYDVTLGFAGVDGGFTIMGMGKPYTDFSYADGVMTLTIQNTYIDESFSVNIPDSSLYGLGEDEVSSLRSGCEFISAENVGDTVVVKISVPDNYDNYSVYTAYSPSTGLPYMAINFESENFNKGYYPAGW